MPRVRRSAPGGPCAVLTSPRRARPHPARSRACLSLSLSTSLPRLSPPGGSRGSVLQLVRETSTVLPFELARVTVPLFTLFDCAFWCRCRASFGERRGLTRVCERFLLTNKKSRLSALTVIWARASAACQPSAEAPLVCTYGLPVSDRFKTCAFGRWPPRTWYLR